MKGNLNCHEFPWQVSVFSVADHDRTKTQPLHRIHVMVIILMSTFHRLPELQWNDGNVKMKSDGGWRKGAKKEKKGRRNIKPASPFMKMGPPLYLILSVGI
jgi:hypothetical protein